MDVFDPKELYSEEDKARPKRTLYLILIMIFLISGIVVLSYYNLLTYQRLRTHDVNDSQVNSGHTASIIYIWITGILSISLLIHFIRERNSIFVNRNLGFKRMSPESTPLNSENIPQEPLMPNRENPIDTYLNL